MSLVVSAPFCLDGSTAIVTGASSGLGERFARVLHAAGCTVVVGARRRERLDDLAADLGDRLVPVTCDVSIDDDLAALHAAALAAGGGRHRRARQQRRHRRPGRRRDRRPGQLPRRVRRQRRRGVRAVAALRAHDARAGERLDRQRRADPRDGCKSRRRSCRRRYCASKGGGEPDPRARVPVGAPRRARQRDRPGLVPVGDDQRRDVRHRREHAVSPPQLPDGSRRRGARARRRAAVPRQRRQQLRHRPDPRRRRRLGRPLSPRSGGTRCRHDDVLRRQNRGGYSSGVGWATGAR